MLNDRSIGRKRLAGSFSLDPRTHFKPGRFLLVAILCLVGGFYLSACNYGFAQDAPVPPPLVDSNSVKESAQQTTNPSGQTKAEEQTQSPEQEKTKKEKKQHRGSILLAPLPIVSPAIGSGFVPVVGYIFPFSKNDKVSPPSTIGASGLLTNNGTRAWAFGGQLFLKEDTYEVTAGYGRGNLNYNLYGIGIPAGNADLKLPLTQTGHILFAEVDRRIAWRIFVGPRFSDGSSFITINPHGANVPPIPPDVGIQTALRSLGVRIVRDTRPNHFYPLSGSKLEFTGDFFSQALGSKYSFQHYILTWDQYFSLGKNQVLAYDLYACNTGGSPPFYGNCIYGASNELRGYVAGRYLDRHMYAGQAEYRLSLPWRLGVAGFMGIGEVVPGPSQILRSNHLLPDIGGGPRFVLSPKYHVNLRTDFARGKNSWTWSMGVGEAF